MSNINEIKKSAVNRVIDILAKHDIKYSKSDFDCDENRVIYNSDYIVVELSYLNGGNRNQVLKSKRKILKKENKNIFLFDQYVIFYFGLKNLETDNNSSDKLNESIFKTESEKKDDDTKTKKNEKQDNGKMKIRETDMDLIKSVADKYNMSLKNLAKIISRQDVNEKKRMDLRFNKDELKIVDEKAEKEGMSRSAFCRYACLKVIREYKDMKNINLLKIRERYGERNREIRVCLIFPDEEEKRQIRDFADNLSMPFTTFMRFCMLRV